MGTGLKAGHLGPNPHPPLSAGDLGGGTGLPGPVFPHCKGGITQRWFSHLPGPLSAADGPSPHGCSAHPELLAAVHPGPSVPGGGWWPLVTQTRSPKAGLHLALWLTQSRAAVDLATESPSCFRRTRIRAAREVKMLRAKGAEKVPAPDGPRWLARRGKEPQAGPADSWPVSA